MMPASKVCTINEISSVTIPQLVIGQVWRSLLGKFTGVHTFIPGRPGAWYTSQRRGLRELRWSCFVMGEDSEDRRNAVTDVATWLDWDEEIKITLSDMPGKYYLGTLTDPPDPEEWREAGIFELVFLIQPYAYDETITTEAWTSDADDNHTWSPAISAPVWPVITITPTNGTLTEFTVETNGDTVSVEANITSGNSITINGLVPIVVSGAGYDADLTGAFDPANVILAGVSGTFPTLMPDVVNNVRFIKVGGTATSFSISVQYRKTYRD